MKYLLLMMMILMMGCTGKKLIVNNADSLISYQITKRIPLYSEQKKSLDKDIDLFLNDHKKSAKALAPILDDIHAPHTDIDKTYGTLVERYREMANDFSKLLSRYMAVLDPKQQKDMFYTLDKENKKLSSKTSKERMNEITERFVKFFGSITAEQKAIFNTYSNYYIENMSNHLKRRENLHQNFREIYGMDSSLETRINQFYSAFMKYQDDLLAPNKTLEITKKITSSLTPPQKDIMKKKTEEIKEILNYYMQAEF